MDNIGADDVSNIDGVLKRVYSKKNPGKKLIKNSPERFKNLRSYMKGVKGINNPTIITSDTNG